MFAQPLYLLERLSLILNIKIEIGYINKLQTNMVLFRATHASMSTCLLCRRPRSVSPLGGGAWNIHATLASINAMGDLYGRWQEAEPKKGYDAKTAEYRALYEALSGDASP